MSAPGSDQDPFKKIPHFDTTFYQKLTPEILPKAIQQLSKRWSKNDPQHYYKALGPKMPPR